MTPSGVDQQRGREDEVLDAGIHRASAPPAVNPAPPDVQIFRVPERLAGLGTQLLRPLMALSNQPTLQTPDAVTGWNLSLPVDPATLWGELGLTPEVPSYREGIPRVLDDCVAFRWRHPVADRRH